MMVERPTKVMHNDKMVDATDVPVAESTEKWSEFTLEDGTVIRMKATLVSAARVKGEYDSQGNPVYVMNLASAIGFASVPEKLLKKN
jgi:hypothetical protein